MSERVVSRTVVVAASPSEVFDLLADFRRHREFDGSGTVREGVFGPERLALGANFGVRMRLGVRYRMSNEVVEFDEGRRIAWRHMGHHVWRYVIAPHAEGTQITESFDWGPSRSPRMIELLRFPARNTRGIEATMVRLQDRFGALAP